MVASNTQPANRLWSRLALWTVVAYATLAGLRTMSDPDVWWQMASGRYLITTGHIARTEVFSYTAHGAPWIYPVGAGLLFYAVQALGGVTLLSLLSPIACGFTAWLLVRRGGLLRAAIVALAVPAISATTLVRANLFTTILAAAFLTILLDATDPPGDGTVASPAASRAASRLWLLPVLMLGWVNLHPGFIYGLAMVLAFTVRSPRRLAPIALATLIATMANPWGWRVYDAIAAQNAAMPLHRAFISEWGRMPLTWAAVHDGILGWRDPSVELLWMFALAAIGVITGLLRKRLWSPLILVASAGAAITYARFQGLFVIAAAAVLPDLLAGIPLGPSTRLAAYTRLAASTRLAAAGRAARPLAAALIIAFAAWRSEQLVTNEFYFSHGTNESFGTGLSPWMPVNAATFIATHNPPRELYHDYGVGGYLMWRLAPRYPVFIDGRALPYGDALFVQQEKLGGATPAQREWTTAIEHWHFRTVITTLDRFTGYGVPLRAFCDSPRFHLRFLDDRAAIFVLASDDSENTAPMSCETAQIPPLPAGASRAPRYAYWGNLARLYNELTRPQDAERAIAECRRIFERDAEVYIELARLRTVQERFAEAESAYRRAVEISPSSSTYGELGEFLKRQERFYEAFQCMRQAAARASRLHVAYSALAMSALQAGRPQAAYEAAGRALQESPYNGVAAPLGETFATRLHGIRAEALLSMVRIPEAAAELEQAVRLAPPGSRLQETLYLRLADAYYQCGRNADAERALVASKNSALKHDDTIDDPQGVAESNITSRKRLEWLLTQKP